MRKRNSLDLFGLHMYVQIPTVMIQEVQEMIKDVIEPSAWLKTDIIPDTSLALCANCGGKLIRESLLKI